MRLKELLQNVDIKQKIGFKNNKVEDITISYSENLKGKVLVLFNGEIKRKNLTNKDFISCKAAAIITDMFFDCDSPLIIVKDLRRAYSVLSANFYGNAKDFLNIIFVTGTNGKKTTTYFIQQIYKFCGEDIEVIGTLGCTYNDYYFDSGMTTPDPNVLHKVLKDYVSLGCKTVVMEASAHSIYLQKLYGIKGKVAVLTNCRRDHLDFFKTEEQYKIAKQKLFTDDYAKTKIINYDDSLGKSLFLLDNTITYAINDNALYSANEINFDNGLNFCLNTKNDKIRCNTQIFGRFNIYNILAAVATCISMGLPKENVYESINYLSPIKGRLEKVVNDKKINVIIDFAHTHDALLNVITAAREQTKGNVITVFGCGGDRDKGKRSIMGKISCENSDLSIITSDNPRTEDPMKIIDEIVQGAKSTKGKYVVICGRSSAISYAIKSAQKDDTILVAGKGAENYMEIDNVKYPYSDYEEITKILMEK